MITKQPTHHRISPTAWMEQLASPKSRLRVRLGIVPGRFHTPAEWDVREPGITEHLVYYFAQESARAMVAGQAFPCPRGSCCWVTPGTPFQFVSNRMPLVWRFRFSLHDDRRRSLAPARSHYFLSNSPAVAETINALLLELAHPDRWKDAALRAWLTQLAIHFFRASHPQVRYGLTLAQQQAVNALVENVRPGQFLQPRDLARAAGLSLDYFSRAFQRTNGFAPRRWLVQQRLAYAVVLLQETPLRIGEIARRLGYANPHLFTRQFTTHFGRSPRSFRS